MEETLTLEQQHAALVDEYKLLQHEHETLKKQLGQEVAELRSANIRLSHSNRRLLEDLDGKKNEVVAGQGLARDLQVQVESLADQVSAADAKASAATDRYNQIVSKIAELREAVKPLISLVSRA